MGLAVIKSIYERKDEAREKARKSLMRDIFSVLKRFSEEVCFSEAYIFGSVTKPYQFGESSDVDIAFKGLDRDRLFASISFLSRELGRDVTVALMEDVHFKQKILREGIKWKTD